MAKKPITQKAKSSPFKQVVAGNLLSGEGEETGVKATRSSANTELIKGEAGVAGKPGKVTGSYKNKMSSEAWKEYLKNETPEQRAKRHAREVKDGVREAGTPATPGTPDVEVTTTRKEEFTPEVYREQTQTTPWENRWARRVMNQQERWKKREARKDLRAIGREEARLTEGSAMDKYKAYRSTMRGENLEGTAKDLYNVSRGIDASQQDILDTRAAKAGLEQTATRGQKTQYADEFKNVDFSSGKGAAEQARIEAGTKTTVEPSMKVTEETTKKEKSPAEMRYAQNVGFKDKSPLKKGYFK